MTKVILLRHGETLWNLEMKYQGHCNIALTEKGLQQAQLAATSLANEKISAIYASDLDRALKTAECIAQKHKLQVVAIPGFREINFGQWEGLTYDKINSESQETLSKLFTHPDEIEIPGGETFREVKERATSALAKLIEKHIDETIVVVSHGGTIRTLLCAALNIHLNYLWNIKQDNTAINILEYHNNQVLVSLVNDTHHLRDFVK
jgi:alpha-ribazole phosphatase